MIVKDFNRTLDSWINGLQSINFVQLCTKPSSNSWSLGQVSMHLLESTYYYLDQARACASSDDHVQEEMSPEAKIMFRNNAFPDEIIEGPPSNAATPQPTNKEELLSDLLKLKTEINQVAQLISSSSCKGKEKHPGLNYFDAREWLQFAEMHFRHHVKQKERINEFLKSNLS
jgi:DinB superfamily